MDGVLCRSYHTRCGGDRAAEEFVMHDVIIIGGGPAGLAAAAYGLGKQLDVKLICAGFGGKAGERQQLAKQASRERLFGEETFTELWHTIAAHPKRILD